MKTLVLLALFIAPFCAAQHDDGEEKLNECKRLTINLIRNNTSNDELTQCLVSMALKGGNYVNIYNNWMTDVAQSSQEELQSQLNNLEAQKTQATEMRKQSFNSMMDNVTRNVQNQSEQMNTQKKSSSTYHCDDCPAGTQR